MARLSVHVTVAPLVALALVAKLVAIASQLSTCPASPAPTPYVVAVAPAIGEPSRCHW